jgi:hypothetical protein
MGEIGDSIPITEEEAMAFCKDGALPDRVQTAIEQDTGYYPEPYDD